ncbi:hypothetical protein WMY93_000911 [Mugilogobius chulae]|uniref:Uncharacterized protein n=1 Tax=Mugilogobius chulae TaxID=88201 RepID=A0AAW0Q8T1_9GOBI
MSKKVKRSKGHFNVHDHLHCLLSVELQVVAAAPGHQPVYLPPVDRLITRTPVGLPPPVGRLITRTPAGLPPPVDRLITVRDEPDEVVSSANLISLTESWLEVQQLVYREN